MSMRFAVATVIAAVSAGLALTAQTQLKDTRPTQVATYREVTEALLRNPPPEDWLNWRRTDNNWGYSTLTQITTQNVQQLQLAWSWHMDDTGANEATPLVHDGIMYLPNPRGVIQALDAATGDLIWEYRRGTEEAPAPRAPNPNAAEQTDIPRQTQRPSVAADGGDNERGIQRNIAIFGDRIFGTTNDAHIVAINAKTGKLVWDTKMADSKLGYQYTAGPIVVRGRVIAGITGCSRYKNDVCFIAGLEASTGRELWRTSSIARPGEPGGDTWGDLPLQFRAGGDMWMSGSYDPETGLIYWGTAQAKPWARVVRGTDGAALYTSSTLALDPDTGKMKWYYQHIPGETQDMDETFERILIDVNGRKSAFTMGKLGILWQIDRVTGKFIKASDIGYQNILRVDESGKVTYNPQMIPQIGIQMDMCPSTAGFKSWRSMAYSPQTNAVYVPININCEHATFGPGPAEKTVGRGGGGPVRRRNYVHPESDGYLGEFRAMDVRDGNTLWRQRFSSPMNTAALTTAGGLVFAGDWDRYMYAFDARNGKILWQTRLPTTAQGFPITYSVRGRQYVAMPAGIGGGSWSTLIAPELRPDIRRPLGGNSLLVFALPDAPTAR
jgi:PQQ-dependent dehydrogenase (methanol/ethanol family)